MKRSLILATSLAMAIVSSQSADAQYRRNERVVISMKVSAWSPQQGAAGTMVTLSGNGFTRKTQVLVGGALVRPVRMGAQSISFKIPRNYGDGQIVLRKPGSANDYVVGRFQVWAAPQITGFAPTSGTVGTKVQLRGRDLSGIKRVTLGNVPVRIDRIGAGGNSIVISIPPGASSNYFDLVGERNTKTRSANQFKIVAKAPYISSFSPSHGYPGSIVRITGGNYDTDVRAYYGRSPLRVLRTTPNWLDVEIPLRARRNQPITISSPRGGQSSAHSFTLENPASVASYSPSWGRVGTQVQLRGQNFMAGDRITIGGQACKILQLQGNQITLVIPPNARGGAISVHRGDQVVTTKTRFDVVYAPQVKKLWPSKGAPGTRVTVNGNGFRGSQFFLGKTPIRPDWIKGSQQLMFTVPRGAAGGTFRVVNRGGQATSPTPFVVWNFPAFSRMSPSRGRINSQITLWGTQLAGAESVSLGNTLLPIIQRGRDRIVVRVPQGAKSGPIRWAAYGQTRPTRWNFSVIAPPVLNTFSPKEGGPGTRVTILGQGYSSRTRVFYGSHPARILRRDAASLEILIPTLASRSEYLSIRDEGGAVSSPVPFGYVAAPTIKSFWPSQSKSGGELTVVGRTLDIKTLVKIGNVTAKNLGMNPDGSLRVAIPNNLPPAKYTVSVQWRGLRTTARRSLTISPWATVNGIRPRIARTGQSIMLSGANLDGVRIFYGQYEMPIVKRDRRGRRLWVTVPKECSGRSVLTIDDQGHRTNTSEALEIFAQVRPPDDIRDHRRPKDILRKRPRRPYPRRRRR